MKHNCISLFVVCLVVLVYFYPAFADPPSSKDQYYKKMVVGKWVLEDSDSHGEMVVSKDGTTIGKGIVKEKNEKLAYKYKSTWSIVNGMWVEKTIESTIPSMIGDTSIDRIISIDSDTFKLISQDGKAMTLRRKK